MAFPATIHTSVGQSLIGKVGRLFNNSIADVLNELLQNARRAGSRRVQIDVIDDGGRSVLLIRDDGCGVEDPAKLVTLGDSGWDAETAHSEDPAGRGVFSLAGRDIEIRSRARGADQGWRVVIPSQAWESGAPLAVEPWDIGTGTEIRIDMPEAWTDQLANAAGNAAQHYPLPVLLRGAELKRVDFLAGAVCIKEWGGCRIGVFHERGHIPSSYPRVNFHGLTVTCPMPDVSEVDACDVWHVRVDIVDAPALQLVLPARKEMVQNAALGSLREATERAIYRAIALHGRHRLAHAQWLRASELGLVLPEAEAWLSAWFPRTADGQGMPEGERVAGVPMVLFPDSEPPIEQCAARVLKTSEVLGGTLVREESAFKGYSWYDALPRVLDISFLVGTDEGSFRYEEGTALPASVQSGRVETLMLDVTVCPAPDSDADSDTYAFPAEVLVAPDDGRSSDLDETVILLSPDCTIEPNDLANLLEDACFCARDDVDDDSWSTQQRYFQMQARQVANTLLCGEDAAILERIRDVVLDDVVWLVPDGRCVTILAERGQVTLAYVPAGGEAVPA